MAEYEEAEIATEACDEEVICEELKMDGKTSEENEEVNFNGDGNSETGCKGAKDRDSDELGNSSELNLDGKVQSSHGNQKKCDSSGHDRIGSVSKDTNGVSDASASADISQPYPENATSSNVTKSSEDIALESESIPTKSSDIEVAENSAESNKQIADSSPALPESDGAIVVDRTESNSGSVGLEMSESSEGSLPTHSQVTTSDVAVASTTSPSESNLQRTPKESSSSRSNHDTDLCQEDVKLSSQDTGLHQGNQQVSNPHLLEQSPNGSTTNMHSSTSNQEELNNQPLSSIENPSNVKTNSNQNDVEINLLQRTCVDSDDDTLLSELDDLLHKSTSGGDLTDTDSSLADLPNGLRRETLEASDSKKLLVEMEVLRRRCNEQEQELTRIQDDCTKKEDHIRTLMQTSQASLVEVTKENDAVKRTLGLRIKELEVVIEQHKQDLSAARERQISHDKAAKKAITQLQQEMLLRVDQVKKLYEEAVKDKENMVIRYAKSEKEVLEQKKARETVEHRLRDVNQATESLHTQIKQLRKELSKLRNSTEEKENEFTSRQKEIEQLKEEMSSQAIKVKWAQNKLKTELDAHKETKSKLAKTEQKLAEAKEETEQIRRNCQEMIKTYQESEEIKSNSLDQELKKKEVELTHHLQEKSDQMELHQTRLRELETLKKNYHDNMAELDSLQVKTKCLEDERLQNEELLSKFKELLNSQKEENRRLTKQVEELKALQHKLEDAQEEVKKMETNMSGQKEEFSELETELEASRQKETELLQFTEKITAKNTQLHSENAALSDKVDVLTADLKKLQDQLEELQTQQHQVTSELKQEKQYRERESAMLTAKLTEKAKAVEQLSIQLEDARDEMKTLKRKNQANVKDLTRQLQQAKKRLESNDSKDGSPKDNISLGSRTSSSGSLDTLPNANSSSSSHGTGSVTASNSTHINSAANNTRFQDHQHPAPDHTVAIASNDYPGIDKNMLVERIVRLQRAQQRKNEKIEFMQEHVNSLVEEIKKKSKIIQQYIMREEAGALAPAASDANKAQMSKQGGIMSSLYRSQATDRTMTLDLSLEINRKLQSVLEDTLLKNITLKENIETLGAEIALLTHKLNAVQQKDQRPKRK